MLQHPAAECAGRVEFVTVGRINKEKFYIISVYLFSVLCIEYIGYKLHFYCLYDARIYMIILIKWIQDRISVYAKLNNICKKISKIHCVVQGK